MKKICVITGSRADYGLLKWVMQGIKHDQDLELQIIATGMHLSAEFGLTVREIEEDGFSIDKKVEMLLSSDSGSSIAKSMGLGLIGMADALSDLKPDCILVLGDRYEIFSAVSAAVVAQIPVVHLHGGEITEGAFDDSFRHSITKMSNLHLVATIEYYHRVVQLGENPRDVHLVGGLGVDGIKRVKFASKANLEKILKIKFSKKNLLVTFHPVTLLSDMGISQLEELLISLNNLKDTTIIFTNSNADNSGRLFLKKINEFIKQNPNASIHGSLGQTNYLSCMMYVDAVVGNSSSGIMEAPSLKTPTINVGERQNGRIKAKSVIDCKPNHKDISDAIEKLYSNEFQKKLVKVKNPYGEGGASDAIINILKKEIHGVCLKKAFFDLPRPRKYRELIS